MAREFGSIEEERDGLDSKPTLVELVDKLDQNEDSQSSWLKDWAGTAADAARYGFFSSTEYARRNHRRLAVRLAQLINLRAKMIDQSRRNGLELVGGAARALGARTAETHSLLGFWKTVQAGSLAFSLYPPGAQAGGSIFLLAWLSAEFTPSSTRIVYTKEPGEVAIDLYHKLNEMRERLDRSEGKYGDHVSQLRESIEPVASTFLELYDFTDNKPNGFTLT